MNKTFRDALAPLHLLQHPFYRDWMEGKLGRGTLKTYACQYFHHVDAFPRYLGAIHSLCENPADRRIILENLNDEEGTHYGKSHPDLWLDFARGMGATEKEVRNSRPGDGVLGVVETFFRLSRSSFAEGIGALYAYESQVPEIAESKIKGLKESYGVESRETLAFFEIHRTADAAHRQALEEIMEKLTVKERALAVKAAETAALSLWNFLSEVHGKNAA